MRAPGRVVQRLLWEERRLGEKVEEAEAEAEGGGGEPREAGCG